MNKNKKIVLIGPNSVVGKYFIKQYKEHSIILINKENQISSISDEVVDTVIFLAQSSEYKNSVLSSDLFNTNIILLHTTLLHFRNNAKKFIYFSTGSVYQNDSNSIINEDTGLKHNSDNPYIITKLAGEMFVNTFKRYYESTYIIRPFFIYGKNQKKGMLFESISSKIEQNEQIFITGKNGLIFNPVFASDVADLCQHLIKTEINEHKIINIHGPEQVKLYDAVLKIAKIKGKEANISFVEGPEIKIIATSNYKLWHSKTNVNQGLQKMFTNEQ